MAITNTEPLSQITGVTPYEKYIDPMRKPMQEAGQAKAELGGLQQGMEAERSAQKVKDVGAVEEQYATQVAAAPEMAEKKRVSEDMEKPFIPTQESAKDMASLFSLINVVGFALGAGGKRNAQGAMSAMNGMLEGHRAGREDVYKKEKTAFDTNLKQLKMRYDTLDNQLKDALNTYKTDKEAGLRKAEMAYAEAGANFYKQYQDKFGLAGMYEFHKQAYDSANKMWTELKREEDRAERLKQYADREARAERRESRADARLAASLAAKAGGGAAPVGALPKDAKTNDEHRFRHSAIQNVREVLDDLQDPQIRRLVGPQNQYMPDVILNLQDKYPALAQKLARFQSQEFQIGGKALTSSEQKILNPIYGWRGLTAKSLEDNLIEAERAMDKEQAYIEGRYPGLASVKYERPTAAPTAPTTTPSGAYSDAEKERRYQEWKRNNP
jgi:hypothetical protein